MNYESPTELIKNLGELLRRPADENPSKFLFELLIARVDILQATAKTRMELAKTRLQVLHPKDPLLTELDRTTQQNSATAHISQDLDMLEGLDELICERMGITLTGGLTP